MDTNVAGLLAFINKAEKLKTELRHSWTSDITRQESVADHSWLLSLMAIVLVDLSDTQVDRHKLLKMVVIHDLAEAVVGDIPAFEVSERQDKKHELEKKALKEIVSDLPKSIAKELMDIWEEMEARETVEAQMAQAIDKLEVVIQHGISDISTWDQNDYDLGVYYKDDYYDFDPFMRALKDAVSSDLWKKLKTAGTLDRLPEDQQKRGEREHK